MNKILLSIILSINLFANVEISFNYPKPFPSKKTETTFGKELISLINKAQNEISFSIYGLRGQDVVLKALLNAEKRGVNIKGVVDSDSKGNNYYSDTYKLYKHFNITSDHKSYIMHNKFFIFDKKIVWTGSSNISDTGTGGYNANSAITIEDKSIALIYQQEFNQMYNGKFGIWKIELSFENIKTTNSVVSIYFSPKSKTYYKSIKKLVHNAKKYIYIPIFYLTHKDLKQELLSAKSRGVEIKIILDASAARNRYSIHNELRKEGIAIKVENFGGKMHCKSMIIDDKYVISGSMNFTKAGNIRNDENTVIIQNKKIAQDYKEYFITLWNQIPNKYLYKNTNPEGKESYNSCFDKIDNDFDKTIDFDDLNCI